jgi:predicted Zn-dependent peptidase
VVAIVVVQAAVAAAVDAVAEDPTLIEQTTLASGLRIVTERMPEARSVSVGCWVAIGSRDEPAELQGASHFLEHLLFKGTGTRNAQQIAEAVDAVGGEMNAFTAKEHTAYYTRLPAPHLAMGLDLLADVVTDPTLRPDEIDAERQVILEELHLSEDEPDERVHTLVHEAMFPEHPLGREVLGTIETIESMGREDIAEFFGAHYRPANLVMVAAGDLRHDAVVDALADRFDDVGAVAAIERTPPTAGAEPLALLRRDTEQAHLALAWPAFSQHDGDRYALAVLNQTLGGGLSSRLFQEIRERRGLAYSVYSYSALYDDAGVLVAYAGTSPDRMGEVRTLIEAEIASLRSEGITHHELTVAKGYLEGSLVLGLEDSGSRMGRLGSNMVERGELTDLDRHLAKIRAVNLDDVAHVIARVLSAPGSVCAVGPVEL